MNKPDDFRSVFSDLPKEMSPSPMLEERTVHELRCQGLLSRPGGFRPPVNRWWLAAAAAAVVVGLLGAFSVGHWQGGRQERKATIAMQEQDAAAAAASVRVTGTSYPEGLEAARGSLYSVADQIVRLAPDDPLATGILHAFARLEPQLDTDERREIVWF